MSTGVMLAFFLPDGVALQLQNAAVAVGLEPTAVEDMHLTLCILGDLTSENDGSVLLDHKQNLIDFLTRFAAAQPVNSISGTISGYGRFESEDGPDPVFATFDSPLLSEFREMLVECVNAAGLLVSVDHGFTPHITLGWAAADLPGEVKPPVLPVAFSALTLAWGDERFVFPLGVPMPEPTYAVKMADDSDATIGGYLARWGSLHDRDLQGEWYSKQTDFALDLWPVKPVFYDHGTDPALKHQLVGRVTALRFDDVGLWCEAQLNKANIYYKGIVELIKRGLLHWSAGTAPNLRLPTTKSASGHIDRWPVIEASLTVHPAEPQMTNVYYVSDLAASAPALKHLGLSDDSIAALLESVSPSAQYSGDDANAESPDVIVIVNDDESEDSEMDLTAEQIQQIATAVVAAQAAAAPAPAPTPDPAPSTKNDGDPAPLPPSRSLPGPRGDQTQIEMIRATKYSHLKAEDMGFLEEICRGTIAGWNPGDAFYRELADKTLKAVATKQLPYEAAEKLINMGITSSTKANELSGVGQTGSGAEFAPDSWRADLWLRTRQDNVIAPALEMIEMPTNPYELPAEGADPTVYYVPETSDQAQMVLSSGNATPESRPGTAKVQMNAKKIALRIAWSTELNEDSIVPIIANYRRQSIRAMQDAIDNVLLNGDTATGASTNINLIDGTPGSTAKYLAFNGIRKYSLVTNTAQKKDAAGGPTLALFRAGRYLLAGRYAQRVRDLLWIVDDNTHGAMLGMPEFVTAEKLGEQATNLTGLIGKMDGITVLASAESPLTDATGKVSGTGANNVKGQANLVFRPNWMVGYRREVTARVSFIDWADAYHLIVTARLCIVSHNFDTQSAACLYDITV